jgi:hypothetical protein
MSTDLTLLVAHGCKDRFIMDLNSRRDDEKTENKLDFSDWSYEELLMSYCTPANIVFFPFAVLQVTIKSLFSNLHQS